MPTAGCAAAGRSSCAACRRPRRTAGLADDLDRRVTQLARQIRHDGITHNVFGEQGAAPRPWSLELLPLIIDAADWAVIEAGVAQRAALMQAMAADAYGPQHLLHEGLFPPALLLRHPGYLRSMQGVMPASGLRLHIVAFDLVRAPDGRWHGADLPRPEPVGPGLCAAQPAAGVAPVPRRLPRAARAAHRHQLPAAAGFDRAAGARRGRRKPRRGWCC